MWTRSPRPPRPMGRTRSTRVAAPGGTVSSLPASQSGAAAAAAGGLPPSRAPSLSTVERRSLSGSLSLDSCPPIVPVECAAELFGVTHKTAFEWRHRVLATVSGFQDRTVLRDTVWVDERYINDTTSPKATGSPASAAYSTRSSAPASPSTFKMNPDAVACGHGKLSSARMRGP